MSGSCFQPLPEAPFVGREPVVLALSSQQRLATAIERARNVTLVAYLLPRGSIFAALAAAARRGAHVTVLLEGSPSFGRDGIRRSNESIVEDLTRAGADARLVDRTTGLVHAKAALVDGALYLDDVNFSRDANATLVRDSESADARAFAAAAEDRVVSAGPNLQLRKGEALRAEAALLATADSNGDVVAESESVGCGNVVYSELERLGKAGLHPRLLVSREALGAKEQALLQCLMQDGVLVRICSANEKFALVGSAAWLGSANATSAYLTPDELDWGARTRNRAIVAQLRSRFEARWQSARELGA